MKTNLVHTMTTHEGGKAARYIPTDAQLERLVASCLLFENTFYESGNTIAQNIADACKSADPATIADLALRAREDWKLRHVPLWLLVQLLQKQTAPEFSKPEAVAAVIQRPDEMGELVSLWLKVTGSKSAKRIPHSLKKGLALAFPKFSEYQLAKWTRDSQGITPRDVMFLCHPRPQSKEQAATWKKLADKALASPDTWEVALSSGADKKQTWERLLSEKKLGDTALLMNLRNMTNSGVDSQLIDMALRTSAFKRILPFRFVTAARYAPSRASTLSDCMLGACSGFKRLPGLTLVVVDVSGSMSDLLSGKGETTRLDAAVGVAILCREVCDSVRVFTFNNSCREVGNYRGLALGQAIGSPSGGTYLKAALEAIARSVGPCDRVVVVTDEQSHDGIPTLTEPMRGYIVNVAPYTPGLSTKGGWTRINGWSERVVDWIAMEETGEIL